MKQITYQEAFQVLRPAGFTGPEIDRLYHLRRFYRTSELDQAPLDMRRLEFIRWLVTAGRLTEQLPEGSEQAARLLSEEGEPDPQATRVRRLISLFGRKERSQE